MRAKLVIVTIRVKINIYTCEYSDVYSNLDLVTRNLLGVIIVSMVS